MSKSIEDIARLTRELVYDLKYTEKEPLGIGGTEFNWIKRFKIPNTIYHIVFTHQIRGDMIQIYIKDKSMCEYIDQTVQYSTLGLNDILNNLSSTRIDTICEELYSLIEHIESDKGESGE